MQDNSHLLRPPDSLSSGLAQQLLLEVSQRSPMSLERAPPNPPSESLGRCRHLGHPSLCVTFRHDGFRVSNSHMGSECMETLAFQRTALQVTESRCHCCFRLSYKQAIKASLLMRREPDTTSWREASRRLCRLVLKPPYICNQ